MEQFTPWPALIGGAFVGLAASMLLLCNGRIAGISGIVGGLLQPSGGDVGWRVAFTAGLLSGGVLLRFAAPGTLPAGAGAGWSTVAAGLLVGLGTQIGSGCTSGHGVCGVSRGSPRSLTATATFMAAGIFTVYVVRHLLGAYS